MKVAVITRHAITNYGSLLQAYATQEVIERFGYSCEIIDYIRKEESYKEHEKTVLKRKPNWYSNPLKRIIYLALRQPENIAAGRKFEQERKELLNLTKLYDSPDAIKQDPPIADVYITGSDQVWGPTENGEYDDSYCLSFTDGKKISYAASFGRVEMNQNLKDYFKKWLKKYNYISVREDSAVKLLSGMKISSRQVLDPTLLLDSSFWYKLLKPIKEKKYILVYQLHNDKKLGEYAIKVAKEKGLPLVRVSSSLHQIMRPGKFIWCPSIGKFLSYIKNADCMITDSFHGTAFAINFGTPFIEVLPNNKTASRNISILKLTGLTDRILSNDNDVMLAKKKIDYSIVNQIIEENRQYSLSVFKNMIEN